MICPKCHTPLEIQTNFCPHCGASLHRGGGRILIVTAACVMAMIIGAYGYVKYQISRPPHASHGPLTAPPAETVSRSRATPSPDVETEAETNRPPAAAAAELILTDVTGRRLLEAPVLILPPGWFAFPVRLCIGAAAWHVILPTGRRLEVAGGILNDGEPVGLWQLPPGDVPAGLELAPWLPDQPLTWHPLDGDPNGRLILVAEVQYLSDFARIELDDAVNGFPGFFLQNGHLVGWSFGELIDGGYLWTGSPGADLAAAFYIDDFYRLTFADGREEAFLLALANEGLTDLQRLEALAAAHQLEPRLAADETPMHLRPAAIHDVMRDLLVPLGSQDSADDLLTIFDAPTVAAVGSPALATDLIQIAWDHGDYGYALKLIDTLEEQAVDPPASRHKFEDLQAAIYRDWLNRLIAAGNQAMADDIYQEAASRFPQDAAIHLAGVELALADQNWPLAEQLLAQKQYPPSLEDKASRLRQEIADLKGQEGKIVIRFQPGSRTIPVVVRLGPSLDQRFVIDTGASLVTVPSATVQRLGIDITGDLPRRLFYSATGVQNAVEVTLPAIELQGWVVENVQALVVDLPGQPEVGLLGMNYLSNFRMDVNTGEGVVMLTPR